MTNEEAITRLKGLYGNGYAKQEQTLDMEIRALKNEQTDGDLISRELAKQMVRDRFNDLSERVEINTVLNEVPSAEKTAEWIPVSERLPERDVSVLAYHKNVSFDYQYISWIDEYSGEWAGFIGNSPDEVLAWMPLPEPYKAE